MELRRALDIARGYCNEHPVAFMVARRIVAELDWRADFTDEALHLWARTRGPGVRRAGAVTAFPVVREEMCALLLVAGTQLTSRAEERLAAVSELIWSVYQTMPVDGVVLMERCQSAEGEGASIRDELVRVLDKHDWVVEAACDDLGWSKPTLYKYAAKFGVRARLNDHREPLSLRRARRLARA